MPLYDYRCEECFEITELLVRPMESENSPSCPRCGSARMEKLVPIVNFKVGRKPAYSDDFMQKALPFLRQQPETARQFAEGKGSDDARAFQIAEQIGQRIDRQLETTAFRKPGR